MNRSYIARLVSISLAVCCLLTLAPPPAQAQQRGVVKDLLKDLIESQLRKGQRRRGPGRANLGPARPPVVAKMTAEQQRQLNRLKPLAAQYVNASAALATGMNEDLSQVPAIRPMVVRALQLNANASALAKRLDASVSQDYLSTTLQQLDQDHRQLAFQIGQIQPAPQRCVRAIRDLDRIRDQVAAIYELQPQVNVRNVAELSGALSVTLDALCDDVGVELRSNPQWRQLVTDGRRVQEQCRSFRFTCAEANRRDVLVDEYKQYLSVWSPYADRIEGFNNQYLARQIRRAHDLNRQISQELLLPIGIDRTRAQHLGELIEEELRSLYGYINLNVLAALPKAEEFPARAVALRAQTKGFCECVTNNEGPAQMRKRWKALFQDWNSFSYLIDPIKNKRIRTLTQEIDSSVLALRDVLGIVPKFDRREVRRLAGSIDTLSDQMQTLVARWGRRGSLPRGVKQDLTTFHNQCHTFHDSALGRPEAAQLLTACDGVVTSWRALHPRIARCDSPEAVALERITDQITVNLVQLETLLAQ